MNYVPFGVIMSGMVFVNMEFTFNFIAIVIVGPIFMVNRKSEVLFSVRLQLDYVRYRLN